MSILIHQLTDQIIYLYDQLPIYVINYGVMARVWSIKEGSKNIIINNKLSSLE